MKPGYKTTEFWTSLVATLAGLFMANGLVPDGDVPMVLELVERITGGIVATISFVTYIISRTKLKTVTSQDLG